MALHRAQDRFLPTLNGNVMTSGGSLNLGKGQMGLFNVKKPTRNGLTAVSNFAGLPMDTELQLRVGNHENMVARTQSNKDKKSRTFKLSEIVGLDVNVPSKQTFDDLIIGYDGINPDTALTFEEGDNEELNITLSGEGIGTIGYKDSKVTFNTYFKKTDADQTNQEIVEKAVEMLKDNVLKEMIPVTTFIDVEVVNSENPSSVPDAVAHTYYNLQVTDEGGSNALGNIQSQYNFKVEQTDRNGLVSTYTVLRPTSEGAPDDFVQSVASVLKGCEDCPSGFTAEDGGFIYYVSLEDDGADSSATVEGLPGAITDSAIKQGQENGKGVYAVATDDELTQAEIDTFISSNPTAVISLVGETADICNDDSTSTISWVAGDECNATTEEYQIQLEDDECGENRLTELQEAYPELTIAVAQDETPEDITGGCQTLYTTEVTTNIICEDCDPIFRGLFESEAPADFGFTSWTKADKTYSESALMGIRIKGKPIQNIPSEFFRDDVPFINTSTHIEVSGGHYTGQSFSYEEGGERFAVKVLNRASDATNLGGDLWALEDRDFVYFNGRPRHRHGFDSVQDQYAKAILGEESVLNPNSQYVIYNLTVAPRTRTQMTGRFLEEKFTYMVAAEVGKHKGVEDLLNNLVASVGLPTVRAYGN